MRSRLTLWLVFGLAVAPAKIDAQSPLQNYPVMRVEALGPERTRVQITSPDGTRLSIETRDITVLPYGNFGGGTVIYLGPGKIVSSLNPELTKEFPCLSIGLPAETGALARQIRAQAESMGKGRWDYGVLKACTQRARLGLE